MRNRAGIFADFKPRWGWRVFFTDLITGRPRLFGFCVNCDTTVRILNETCIHCHESGVIITREYRRAS